MVELIVRDSIVAEIERRFPKVFELDTFDDEAEIGINITHEDGAYRMVIEIYGGNVEISHWTRKIGAPPLGSANQARFVSIADPGCLQKVVNIVEAFLYHDPKIGRISRK